MESKITSTHIKIAVMSYFRFKRQWLCASECLNSDVIAITNKDVIEVEIKISKSDLWHGEAKKGIHCHLKNPDHYYRWMLPTKYYICVPEYLIEEAKKWVEVTNTKYGILEYRHDKYNKIFTLKTAKRIHERIKPEFTHATMMRVCSENIGQMQRLLKEKLDNE